MNPPDLSFHDLRAVITVARTRHFGHAADELGLAQPTLSAQVQKVERTLAVTFFERSARKFLVTPAGERLLPLLREMLASAEYRSRLATKLNCLIAVLEVAIGKIAKSVDVPGANRDRLLKIRANLENTLSICSRAKLTLDKTVEPQARATKAAAKPSMSARDYVELTSIDEYRKFRTMEPITRDQVLGVDFEELARKLLGS